MTPQREWGSGYSTTPVRDWQSATTVASALVGKTAERETIAIQIDEYLAGGGTIEQVPRGVSAYCPNGHRGSRHITVNSEYSIDYRSRAKKQ